MFVIVHVLRDLSFLKIIINNPNLALKTFILIFKDNHFLLKMVSETNFKIFT